MNLAEMRAELGYRGFTSRAATRRDRWLQQAYQDICGRHAWPFLTKTSSVGTRALTISDLRSVIAVIDSTAGNTLPFADYRDLLADDATLADPVTSTTEGAPTHWYQSSDTQIRVYPYSTNSIYVRYIKVPEDLADATEPIFPERFHYLVVEGACVYAYRDTDNLEAANACRDVFEEGILKMGDELLVPNFDNTRVIPGSGVDW